MKNKLLFIAILIININLISAQQKNTDIDFWDNVQFGGGLVLGFSNNVTNVGISPSAIYNFNDKFSSGVGASYLYSKFQDDNDGLNVYGGSLIALYNPINEFQLSAEFEESILSKSGFESTNISSLYFGGGYTIGRNVAIGLRYDVLYDKDKSPYGSAFSPIARIYF